MAPENSAVVGNGPGQAAILDIPYPSLPSPEWLIVRATAVALNPTDYKHLFFPGEASVDGAVLGHDFAGVVEEVGEDLSGKFKKGDRVAGAVNGSNVLQKWQGAMQKYIAANGKLVYKIPENISDVQASTLNTAIITSAISLYQKLGLPLPSQPLTDGTPVFIYGGSGAVAMVGLQLAKLSGCTVITTASPSNFDLLRSLGADHVVDYRSEDLVKEILSFTEGKLLNHAWDAQAVGSSAEVCLSILEDSSSSRVASLGGPRPQALQDKNPKVQWFGTNAYTAYGEKFHLFGVHNAVPEDFEFAGRMIEIGQGLLAEGKLKPTRAFVDRGGRSLAGMLEGLEEMGAGKVRGGKLVYTL